MKKKDLVFLANELNEVLELEDDDVIDADQDPKKLEKELKKCVAGNKPELEIFAEDEFSDEAWELLAELGNEVAILKCEAGEDEAVEDETGEEEEVVVEEEKAEEEAEEIQEERPKKRVKVKKKAEEKAEEIEEQEFYFKGREKPKKKPAEKKEKKKVVEKKKETIEKVRRIDTVLQAIEELCKKGAEFKEIYNRAEEIFVENGGKAGAKSVNVNRYSLIALTHFGVLKERNGKYFFK